MYGTLADPFECVMHNMELFRAWGAWGAWGHMVQLPKVPMVWYLELDIRWVRPSRKIKVYSVIQHHQTYRSQLTEYRSMLLVRGLDVFL